MLKCIYNRASRLITQCVRSAKGFSQGVTPPSNLQKKSINENFETGVYFIIVKFCNFFDFLVFAKSSFLIWQNCNCKILGKIQHTHTPFPICCLLLRGRAICGTLICCKLKIASRGAAPTFW